MNIKSRTLKILFVFTFILFVCASNVKALDSIMQGADNFLNNGTKDILDPSAIKSTSDTLFNIFSTVGVIIVLIAGVVLGIQFMMGSIEEKAKIKEALIPFVIGATVIFGSVGIWSLVINVLQDTF